MAEERGISGWVRGPEGLSASSRRWYGIVSVVALVAGALGVLVTLASLAAILFPPALAFLPPMADTEMYNVLFGGLALAGIINTVAVNGLVWRWTLVEAARRPQRQRIRIILTFLLLVVGSPLLSIAIGVAIFMASYLWFVLLPALIMVVIVLVVARRRAPATPAER